MKTKAILMLICIGMLTSCAGKFGVMKRRYNKGYYVSHSSDPKQQHKPEARKTERDHKAGIAATESFAKTTSSQDPDLQINRSVSALPATAQSGTNTRSKHSVNKVVASTETLKSQKQQIRALSKQLMGANKDLINSGSDSDVNLVLLIILAILIPPLAVYLKNKTIDKWFWITLILSLLGFFGLFFVYGGLFWLAAAVIAILYVLDAL
jgi:uncharacterized membrane protein YqaE (UPF0057 family)